jgi:hypothetical protein
MSHSASGLNQNASNNANTNRNNNNNNYIKRIYSTSTTIKLLKALFENENYYFSSFSSRNHGELVKKVKENSQQQDSIRPVQLTGDPVLNEFVNNFYGIFSNFLSTNDIHKTTNDGMVKYEIHSIQSLNSTTIDNKAKSIWLPKSMIISEAHRIFSTILYSNNLNTIPVDLADYVLVYENIMISLENQSKELYQEILKISFRLNRVALPPFRLLIIHKSQLLILERKESKPLLTDKKSISILQLIMFHLITKNSNQLENETSSTISKDHRNEYWPIIEVKMGIIPSEQLIHPLKHDKLRQIIANIIQTNDLLGELKTNVDLCIKLLEKIFLSVNGDISYIKLITSSLSKLVEIYDYPLLIALPYDRLLLCQFCKTECSDGRLAQGIMANGKYYSLANNLYTPMSELKINCGSIIHLRFNWQDDTIVNGSISSHPNKITINESYEERSGYHCSVYCDNNTVHLMFPSNVIDSIISANNTTTLNNTRINYLWSYLKASNNWIDSSIKINQLIISDTDQLRMEDTHYTQTDRNNYSDQISTNDYSLATLINNPSTYSLLLVDKPECINCLSSLNDDNLECPYCTQVFCRICIESSYDDETRDRCCPKCHNLVELSAYQKSTIIRKFEEEGISAFKCLNCKLIPKSHRLCRDPKCSALFCYNCCKKATEFQASSTTQELNTTGTIKCLQCKTGDTYVSCAVLYYTARIIAYQTAQEVESTNPSFPNTVWKEEDYLAEKGMLEENHNRIISVIQFNGEHIQFDNNQESCPLLIINEPFEYTCPESLQLSYWNADNQINRWENDKNVQFYRYNKGSIAAAIPHFSIFTARNTRFRENIMLDKAFLDITYDYDFTTINDTGQTFLRGPEPYTRPCGWYRKSIRVFGKFENNTWLGEDKNAWPVAYHGTATTNALSILRTGLLAGGSNGVPIVNGLAHGRGIYLSPNPLFSSLEHYSKPLYVDGRRYQIMFQVRVKSDSIIKTSNIDVWKCNNSKDIRPYGILFKET